MRSRVGWLMGGNERGGEWERGRNGNVHVEKQRQTTKIMKKEKKLTKNKQKINKKFETKESIF